eukprot:156980_1
MPGNEATRGKTRKVPTKGRNPRSSKRARNTASDPIMDTPMPTTTSPRRSLRLITSRKPQVPRMNASSHQSAFQIRQNRLIDMVISAPGGASIIASGSTAGSPIALTMPKSTAPSISRRNLDKMEVDKTPSPSLSPPAPDNILNVNNLHMSSDRIPHYQFHSVQYYH